MFGLEKRRRERLRSQPFPAEWLAIVERNVPLYRRLSPEDRRELQGHVQVLLAEKNFEGAGGLEMNDEIRVTVAAQAAVLLLHRETDPFPRLGSVVVYPAAFVVERDEMVDQGGFMVEGPEARLGESWAHGAVVLSWSDVQEGAANPSDGRNVVLHEFAHQLDQESGSMDGVPLLDENPSRWIRLLRDEFQVLRDAAENGRATVLDDYGAESAAEFFAVATETFFERPGDLRSQRPALYDALRRFFNQDPAAWITEPR